MRRNCGNHNHENDSTHTQTDERWRSLKCLRAFDQFWPSALDSNGCPRTHHTASIGQAIKLREAIVEPPWQSEKIVRTGTSTILQGSHRRQTAELPTQKALGRLGIATISSIFLSKTISRRIHLLPLGSIFQPPGWSIMRLALRLGMGPFINPFVYEP